MLFSVISQASLTCFIVIFLIMFMTKIYLFELTRDVSFTGGFQAHWSDFFLLVKEQVLLNFGEQPLKICFDENADFEIRNKANLPFKHYNLLKQGYADFLIVHYTYIYWCLCGGNEVCS